MSIENKYYYPEVGLDEAKTAEGYYKDLRYYMQDENIPAIEQIQQICEWEHMPFEAQMCKFAKESVEIDKKGELPYNIGDIKRDMAEDLKNTGYYRTEIEYNADSKQSTICIEATSNAGDKSLDDAKVSVNVHEFDFDRNSEITGNGVINFGKFKEMIPSGFDVEHGSFESFVNEIRFYANEISIEPLVSEENKNVKPWFPDSNNNKSVKSKEKNEDINR